MAAYPPSYRGRRGTWCRECSRTRYAPRPKPPSAPDGYHRCTRCGLVNLTENFYTATTGRPRQPCKACFREWHRGRYVPKGTATDDPRECVVCGVVFRPKKRAAVTHCSRVCTEKARSDSGRRREADLRSKYGIGVEDYDRMLVEQSGGCAICRRGPEVNRNGFQKFLHVDHDHDSGRVRGLLCDRCNLSIGQFEHNPELLERAAAYLVRTSRNRPVGGDPWRP